VFAYSVAALVLSSARLAVSQPAAPDSGLPPRPEAEQVEAKKLSKVPKQTKFVQAEYPPQAMAEGIQADVVLLLDIDETGKVTSAGVAEPTQPEGYGFDEAAIVAALQFEFEPAEMEGKPIAVQLNYRYRFTLTPKPEPAPEPEAAPVAGTVAPPPAPKRAPVVNFSGVLLERGTRTPLAGVLVTVFRDDKDQPVGFEATADEQGRFTFKDLEPGPWKILVDPPGYFPFRTAEDVVEGEVTTVTYFVEKGSYNPYDVTVTATKPRKEVSRTVLTAREIDKIPGAIGDPLAVVQNFPGVARTPVFSGQIIVRGSAPEDTKVFVDSIEVPLIYHFGGLRSVVPVGILQSIEFYPGNFSSYYGRATGGIIDVQVKKLQPPRTGGYIDVSLLDTGVYLEVPIGKDGKQGAVAIAGRRSYVDFVLNAVIPDSAGVNLIAAPRYYDYQLLANYRPAPAHDLRLFIFGSDDVLELLFDNPGEFSTQVTGSGLSASTAFYRALATYKYVPNPSFEHTSRLAVGRDFLNFSFGTLTFDLAITSVQLRDGVRHKLNDWLALAYGVDVLFQGVNGFIRLPLPPKEGEPPGTFDAEDTRTADINDLTFWSPAGYAEVEVTPASRLLILPGVRFDYFSRVTRMLVQPRLTVRYGLTDQWTVKGGVGLFGQPPDFDETDDNFGNPNLGTEKAIHYSAGVEWKPQPWITLDATGFYKTLHDLASPTDANRPDDATRPLVYDNQGKGRVIGLELVARHDFTKRFSGWLAYTLSRAERTDSGADGSRLFDYDQPHILTAIAGYLLPRNWQVGARFRVVSGNPRTPTIGGVWNNGTDRYDPFYGMVNSARNGTFHQLDLRVDKRWIFQSWILNLYLDVQNVYNRANPEGQTFNYDFTASGVQQGLPILPILGVRAEL
jgi:TonB family protein